MHRCIHVWYSEIDTTVNVSDVGDICIGKLKLIFCLDHKRLRNNLAYYVKGV